MDVPLLEPQSGTERFGVTMNQGSTDTSFQNVAFSDQNPSYTYTVDSMPDPTFYSSDTSDSDLQGFMSRPIKIASYNWAVDGVLFEKFNPWDLFFKNKRVINRIANFQLMRSKLHVKIVLNGTGFHYGRAIASYVPLPTYDNLTVDRAFFSEDIVQASQRPHIYLDPTTSQGGDLVLPYFWLKDYLSIPDSEFSKMGEMIIHGFVPLKHANGATDGVTISVFAWAEEFSMSVPTSVTPAAISPQSGYEPQSGDEYGTGPVSRPASVLARAAGALRTAPVIGMYARATEIAANAVSSVATIFGYARPVDVTPVKSYKPTYLGNMANTNVEDSSTKLSTDIKQELSIDPRVVGLGSADEMAISNIATRESYLTTFPWAVTAPTERRLFSMAVDPCLHARLDSSGNGMELHLPACAFAVLPFQYWRGSMDIRFQIIASNYHKGRLKIVYEPYQSLTATAEYNTNYTYIVDIAESKDFTVKVGWGREHGFRKHFSVFSPMTAMFRSDGSDIALNGSSTTTNGRLSVYVVNEIAVPNTIVDNDIAVNVFISACDDLEVASPNWEFLRQLSVTREPVVRQPGRGITPQSGVETGDVEDTVEPSAPMQTQVNQVLASPPSVTDNMTSVYFGESIKSFRALVKRYTLLENAVFDPPGTETTFGTWASTRYFFPWYRGYPQSQGLWNLDGVEYNLGETTWLNYVAPAYSGFRGGVRHKIMLTKPGDGSVGDVQTLTRIQDSTSYAADSYAPLPIDDYDKAKQIRSSGRDGANGMIVVPTDRNPVVEAEVPMFTNWRFFPAKDAEWIDRRSLPYEDSVTPQFRWNTVIDAGAGLHLRRHYVAAADDFSCYFFTGAPIWYAYGDPDSPAQPSVYNLDQENEI